MFADAGNTAVAAWPDPVTTNSNLPVFISCSPQEGTLLQIGNEIVTCLATDTIRSDSCTFNVVVVSKFMLLIAVFLLFFKILKAECSWLDEIYIFPTVILYYSYD